MSGVCSGATYLHKLCALLIEACRGAPSSTKTGILAHKSSSPERAKLDFKPKGSSPVTAQSWGTEGTSRKASSTKCPSFINFQMHTPKNYIFRLSRSSLQLIINTKLFITKEKEENTHRAVLKCRLIHVRYNFTFFRLVNYYNLLKRNSTAAGATDIIRAQKTPRKAFVCQPKTETRMPHISVR